MRAISDVEVLDLPISEDRKRRFLKNYRADREKASTIEKLFERAGAFVRNPETNKKNLLGIDALIRKVPFCDLPNWAEYRTWEFAVATESYLLKLFKKLIGESEKQPSKRMNAEELSLAMSAASDAAAENGDHDLVLVFTGDISTDEVVDLYQLGAMKPSWGNDAIFDSPWILGLRDGLPILQLPEQEPPDVCAVDLAKLATLTKFGDVEFKVTEIDEKRARDILLKKQPDEPVTETAIDELRRKVHLRIAESFAFTTHDSRAVFWANR